MTETLHRFTKATRETGVDGHMTFDEPRVVLKADEIPAPLHPEDDGYWDEFGKTIDAVCAAHDRARMERGVADPFHRAINRSALGAAEFVRRDWPSENLMILAKQLPAAKFRAFKGLRNDFTDGVVMLNHLMGWAAHAVSPTSFAVKWEHMAIRPEEVAGLIARDEMDAPSHIKTRLFDMVPQKTLAADQRRFTAFFEGCPMHPSYWAMHAAASGAVGAVMKVLYDLTPSDTDTVNLGIYNVAHFRSTAGVHNPQDNAVGLWGGQEIMKRLLPAKLHEVAGIPKKTTEKLLNETAENWL